MKQVLENDWHEEYLKEINYVQQKYELKAEEEFKKWIFESSKEDRALRSKALKFEDRHFKDMTLRSYSRQLTRAKMQDSISGEWDTIEDGFEQDYDLSLSSWIIRYDNLKGNVGGICEWPIKQIRIKPGQEGEELVLLHEMIHAFEFLLKDFNEYYQQYVTIQLYKKLRSKVRNLMRQITYDVHKYFKIHSPLFMLKSLDLDLKFKKPLGTVYGYERADFFFNR